MSQAYVSISSTCFDGREMSVLGDLIQKRFRVMRERGRDAVIATAIDVLKSVRAGTVSAVKRKKFNIGIEQTPYYGGWYSNARHSPKRCLRLGLGRHAPRVMPPVDGMRVVWRDANVKVAADRKVFKVVPEHGEPYLVSCTSADEAKRIETARARTRIRYTGGLAKNALSVGMNMLSTRSLPMEGGADARKVASKVAHTFLNDYENGSAFHLKFVDDLQYALEALKGGKRGLSIAMMKAANKISGMLAKEAERRGLDEEFPTPFPEVKRRKA